MYILITQKKPAWQNVKKFLIKYIYDLEFCRTTCNQELTASREQLPL